LAWKNIFLKNFELENLVYQSKFHLQNTVCNFEPPRKSYGQNLEGIGLKMSKKMSLPTPLRNLSVAFDWSLENSNEFLEIKASLIFHIKLVQSCKKEVILHYLNEV